MYTQIDIMYIYQFSLGICKKIQSKWKTNYIYNLPDQKYAVFEFIWWYNTIYHLLNMRAHFLLHT